MIVCLVCNAVFVIGKFAFVQLRREYVEDLVRAGRDGAPFLLRLYDRPTVFLGMAQLGMAISSISAGALVAVILFQL